MWIMDWSSDVCFSDLAATEQGSPLTGRRSSKGVIDSVAMVHASSPQCVLQILSEQHRYPTDVCFIGVKSKQVLCRSSCVSAGVIPLAFLHSITQEGIPPCNVSPVVSSPLVHSQALSPALARWLTPNPPFEP